MGFARPGRIRESVVHEDGESISDIAASFKRSLLKSRERKAIQETEPLSSRQRETIVIVDDVSDETSGRMITVFVPRWRQNEPVRISENVFPIAVRQDLKKGVFLTATVNTEANDADELRFENFELIQDEENDDI